ncbi:MAG: non-heme chloroperoxidase [Acidobacteriaceae bacterium]|nr:non-heme chloroperoxidase [Acidobacteriaceae bacterium]
MWATHYVLLFLSLLLVPSAVCGAATVKDGYFITSDGVKLHYLESGAGSTILFVPGWTMPAEIWQPQIEYFSKSYHVVAVDPRSQGASDKPAEGNYPGRRAQDYKELIDHLGGAPVVMVGWSLAVHEALTYVEMFGTDKLNALVLIDLNVYTPSTQEERDRRYTMLHNFQADRKQFAATFVRGMYHKPQTETYLESVIAASLKTPTNSAVAMLAEYAVKNDLRPALPKLNIPVLAAMTENNRSSAELITSAVPGSQAEVFEDAGHCLFVDDADRFDAVLATFLQKASLGSRK